MTKNTLTILTGAAMFDVLGFYLWFFSGQVPADGFYIGALTANLIKLWL